MYPAPSTSSKVGAKVVAKELIEKYYHQLTVGCGNLYCLNSNCKSSGKLTNLTSNAAAATSLRLLKRRAMLCEEMNSTSQSHGKFVTLNHTKLLAIIEEMKTTKDIKPINQILRDVFSNPSNLKQSWLTPTVLLDTNNEFLSKSEVHSLHNQTEMEMDDSVIEIFDSERVTDVTVDMESLQHSFRALNSVDQNILDKVVVSSCVSLMRNIEDEMKCFDLSRFERIKHNINPFVILMELPVLSNEEYVDSVMPMVCGAIARLSVVARTKISRFWSTVGPDRLRLLVQNIQQIISLRVYNGSFTDTNLLNDDSVIINAVIVLEILFGANIIGGVISDEVIEPYKRALVSSNCINIEDDAGLLIPIETSARNSSIIDEYHCVNPFWRELGVLPMDSLNPVIPFHEFCNEPLCQELEIEQEFARWKTAASLANNNQVISQVDNSSPTADSTLFTFLIYPFILNTETKTEGLYSDNRIRMYNERHLNVFQAFAFGLDAYNPYLKLQVRRDHIIEDTLIELEIIVNEDKNDLKKQLVVEFDGEQGVDEGGVSKEFFQLVVEEMFNPAYSLFVHCDETETFWFNSECFETDSQFVLFGIILGLAIYNNVILDIHFPIVLYKKLLGRKGTLNDLQYFKPSIYKSLMETLAYDGDDMEDVYMQNFQVSYNDIFGNIICKDLVEDAANIKLNQSNKVDFCHRYADFLLNENVKDQFNAFRKGFDTIVTNAGPIKSLFLPSELESLVCGEKEFNFSDLEEATSYDGGYTKSSVTILFFWKVVHLFSEENKKKLLRFTTGSDRVPIGGLAKLKLVITRTGAESDRLPTAHTCHNVLLLPDYKDINILRDRLIQAVGYFHGFGLY